MENKSLKQTVLSSLTNDQGYVILLLGSDDFQPIKGKLWYQKEMFYLSNNFDVLKESIDFEPYFIGPHSKKLEEVLNQLKFYKILEFDKNKIKLTEFGKEIFNIIKFKRPNDELIKISEIKNLLNDMTNDELLVFIYSSINKNFITESVEYNRVMKDRERLAINLYKKGKISLSKSAEIADISIEEMMKRLKKIKIPIR